MLLELNLNESFLHYRRHLHNCFDNDIVADINDIVADINDIMADINDIVADINDIVADI